MNELVAGLVTFVALLAIAILGFIAGLFVGVGSTEELIGKQCEHSQSVVIKRQAYSCAKK